MRCKIDIKTVLMAILAGILIQACKDSSSGPEPEPELPVELQITSIEPDSGTAGTKVTITGSGFDPVASQNKVIFNGVESAVDSATATQLFTTVPEGASTGPIVVTVAGETANGPEFEVITTGILEIQISTKRPELEPDGYQIVLDGKEQVRIDPVDSSFIELEEGSYEIELRDFINFCSPTGKSNQLVDITVGDTTSVAFNVECQAVFDNQIVFTRNNIETGFRTRLYVMNSDGSNVLQLTENTNFDNSVPVISPNGEKVAFVSNVDIDAVNFDVFIMDADGKNRIRLTTDAGFDEDPSWSPDGTQIMFESSREDVQHIYIMSEDGSGLKKITSHPFGEFDPEWSPNGDKIVFVANRSPNFQIFVINIDGSNEMTLTGESSDNFSPSWSPDGNQIVFLSDRDGNREIYTMNADGSNQVRLTNNEIQDLKPGWSPDGTQIIFFREEGIFKMDKDGTDIIQLTNVGDYSDGYPDWGPKNEL